MMTKNQLIIINFRVDIKSAKNLKACDISKSKDFIICSPSNYGNSSVNLREWIISFTVLTLMFISTKDIKEHRARICLKSLFETAAKYYSITFILLIMIGLPKLTA